MCSTPPVQAAIGAVPLAAGLASGDVILAAALLSIQLTSPLGAIGIMLGRKVPEKDEHANYKFRDLRKKLSLPHMGEGVRNKHFGTVWKGIEEKEKWLEIVHLLTKNGKFFMAGDGYWSFLAKFPFDAI